MAGVRSFFANLFASFSARSSKEERIGAYIIREHERGRQLTEILDDPYIRNRATPQEIARILDRPEVIHALGANVAEAERDRRS